MWGTLSSLSGCTIVTVIPAIPLVTPRCTWRSLVIRVVKAADLQRPPAAVASTGRSAAHSRSSHHPGASMAAWWPKRYPRATVGKPLHFQCYRLWPTFCSLEVPRPPTWHDQNGLHIGSLYMHSSFLAPKILYWEVRSGNFFQQPLWAPQPLKHYQGSKFCPYSSLQLNLRKQQQWVMTRIHTKPTGIESKNWKKEVVHWHPFTLMPGHT